MILKTKKILKPRRWSIRNQSTFWKIKKTLGLRTKRGQLKPLVSEGLTLRGIRRYKSETVDGREE